MSSSPGEGPVVHTPIRTLEHVQALRTDHTEDLLYVSRAIEKVAAHFAQPEKIRDRDQLGIIGFCGAPFTLASYMIEGGSSRNYVEAKRMMYASGIGDRTWPHPDGKNLWTVLDRRTPRSSSPRAPTSSRSSTRGPARSRVAGLPPVLPRTPLRSSSRRIRSLGVPVIYFGVDTASLLPAMRETGADVLGLDWRIPLDEGWRAIGSGTAVQGNLDPIALFAPEEVLHSRVKLILDQAANRPGHIFNLGHGIVPGTPVEAVVNVARWVQELSAHQPDL